MKEAIPFTFQACRGVLVKGTIKKKPSITSSKEAIELYLEPVADDFTPSPDTEIMEIARLFNRDEISFALLTSERLNK